MAIRRLLPTIFILAMALYISAQVAYAAGEKKKVTCVYCGEAILTQYVEIDGKYYHPIHFKCETCGAPIGHTKYFKKDGKYYCEKCFMRLFAPRCTYCGNGIDGNAVIFEGKNYHDSCFYNHVALKCGICGEIIKETYLLDFWGNAYHSRHKNEYPTCEHCGRLICEQFTGGGIRYPEGRHVCNLCLPSTINEIDRAESILEKVRSYLALEGIRINEKNIGLHLIGRDELNKLANTQSDDQNGYTICKETRRMLVLTNREFDIYLLDGMPEANLIAVAAHELMHVWQYENVPGDNDKIFSEGSCNYASLLVLKYFPGQMTDYLISTMIQDKDPVYGEGFRRIKKLVEDHGVEFWLRQLKNLKTFPQGY